MKLLQPVMKNGAVIQQIGGKLVFQILVLKLWLGVPIGFLWGNLSVSVLLGWFLEYTDRL
jgi:hypothetical protein